MRASGEQRLGSTEEGSSEDNDSGGSVPRSGILGSRELGKHSSDGLEKRHAGEDGGAVVGAVAVVVVATAEFGASGSRG